MLSSIILIGLTGGIAAGKSTVARILSERGIPVIDADVIAREQLRPGSPVYSKVLQTFGSTIQTEDGAIDRRKLGAIVFSDTSARKQLEAITHPAIIHAVELQLHQFAKQGITRVCYEASLLVETGRYQQMDLLIVVRAEDAVRLQRLIVRDSLDPKEAHARLNSQAPQDEKVALADIVIDNSNDIAETRRQIDAAWEQIVRSGRKRS